MTIKGAGTAKIIAIKAGDANYNPIANSYVLTVNVIKFEFMQSQINRKYSADLTIQTDLMIEHIVRGQVRFESDKTSVATVDNNGLLSIRGVGTATITAKRSTDRHSVRELTAMLSLTITKGDQEPLVFDKSELPVGLKRTTASNIARGGSSSGAITYSIDNTNVATVNSTNGELILKSTGTATVTATKAGDANYSTISNSYMLEVNNKLDQPELSFARNLIILDYQVGGVTTSNIAQGGTGTGAISYRSNNEDVATVDNSGVVTIKSAGTVIIRATKAGDANYNPTEASYQLMVNKIAQSGFGFTQSTITLTYLTDKTTTNIPQGGQSKGVVTYRSNNQDVATVNDDGQVTINGAGTAIITATKAEDTNYKATQASYALVVNKAPQTGFHFAKDVFITAYAADKQISNIPQGGQGEGAITYKIDKTSVATIDSTNGVLTLKSTGTATITAMKAGDDDYLPTSATYSLKVMEFSINSTLTLGIKNIKLAWSDVAGTNHYRLLAELGGGFVDASTTGFLVVPNSNNIKQTTARADIALHRYIPLLNGNDPLYRVESCDNTNTCSNNAVINASLSNAQLNQLIGYFKASNSNFFNRFGLSVSLSDDGNSLVVGSDADSVYLFVRNSSSAQWTQQAHIKTSDPTLVDLFGFSVSLSSDGNTLAVSAALDDSNSTGVNDMPQRSDANFNAGAVYVFTRSSTGTWKEQAYIKASNTDAHDQFGYSVSLSDDGNSLAVGAINEDSNAKGIDGAQDNNSTSNSGAVYVFTRSGEDWTQQAYIKASNSGAGDQFGLSVSLSGNGHTLAVGARHEDSNSTGVGGVDNNNSINTGAVYVFTRNGTDWSQQAYIKASNSGAGDQFGFFVSLSEDGHTLAVAAVDEDSNATGVGGAQDNNSTSNSGAVYVFTRSGSTWSQQAYIKASNSGAGDQFGSAVSLSGDGNSLAVGAWIEDSNAKGVGGEQNDDSAEDSGAVYFFTRSGSTWQQQAYVKASNSGVGDQFGLSVSLSGDGNSLAVGATGEDSSAKGIGGAQGDGTNNSGAVYLY